MIPSHIADLIKVIGNTAENDLSPAVLEELDGVLSLLIRYVRAVELSKRHRLTGHISAAVDRENIADEYYRLLPLNCKW